VWHRHLGTIASVSLCRVLAVSCRHSHENSASWQILCTSSIISPCVYFSPFGCLPTNWIHERGDSTLVPVVSFTNWIHEKGDSTLVVSFTNWIHERGDSTLVVSFFAPCSEFLGNGLLYLQISKIVHVPTSKTQSSPGSLPNFATWQRPPIYPKNRREKRSTRTCTASLLCPPLPAVAGIIQILEPAS